MHIPCEWVWCAHALQHHQQQRQLLYDDVNLQEMWFIVLHISFRQLHATRQQHNAKCIYASMMWYISQPIRDSFEFLVVVKYFMHFFFMNEYDEKSIQVCEYAFYSLWLTENYFLKGLSRRISPLLRQFYVWISE